MSRDKPRIKQVGEKLAHSSVCCQRRGPDVALERHAGSCPAHHQTTTASGPGMSCLKRLSWHAKATDAGASWDEGGCEQKQNKAAADAKDENEIQP